MCIRDRLRDILSEYEQHIDMKVKSGLSEEEAIADFGSLPELTAEILEAYHVRADYGPGQRGGDGWRAAADGRNDGDGPSEGQGDGEKERRAAAEMWKARAAGSGKKAAGFFSELGRRAVRLARRTGRWVSDVFVFWRELLGRPFRRFSRLWKQRREERLYRTDGSMEMENACLLYTSCGGKEGGKQADCDGEPPGKDMSPEFFYSFPGAAAFQYKCW